MNIHTSMHIQEKHHIQKLLDDIRHFLPQQAPLQFFVHHNTLHAFEHLHFKDAIQQASTMFGSEPFWTEEHYARALLEKRIDSQDLQAILEDTDKDTVFGHVNKYDYRLWRLCHPFTIPANHSKEWWLYEQPTLEKPHSFWRSGIKNNDNHHIVPPSSENLSDLWKTLKPSSFDLKEAPSSLTYRLRDILLKQTGHDSDIYVHSLMIRLASAYLDQGVAHKVMPTRDKGFLVSIRQYFMSGVLNGAEWLDDIGNEMRHQTLQGYSAYNVIEIMLERMQIQAQDKQQVILQTLLSLKGWAGMFAYLEDNPQKAPIHTIPARLADYLAVQLCLEWFATQYIQKLPPLSDINHQIDISFPQHYEAFIVAQAFNLRADNISPHDVRCLYQELNSFNDFERRYAYHLAFERHYRQEILDSIVLNQSYNNHSISKSPVQIICCMDEREESFRRYIEETIPNATSYGMAGFFGVAMLYQGLTDIDPRALCPVVVSPQHYVKEEACNADDKKNFFKKLRHRGAWLNKMRVARKTAFLGMIWSFVATLTKPFLLIGRSLFPCLMHNTIDWFLNLDMEFPKTKLKLEAKDSNSKHHGIKSGYSIDEMTDIVCNSLKTLGLTKDFSPFVVIIGHGSSSLNNPHLAAYNCGATGGGCGHANARAFAVMANHVEVRKKLAERDIFISETTWFIGAYHNTTDDTMLYYDIDDIPSLMINDFKNLSGQLDIVCEKNAHERTRRFTHTPHSPLDKQAKKHAEQHARDIAEARPEYGHSTNAVCFIGRREKTKNLYLDRRCFLISYDPLSDEGGEILGNILRTAGPVGAGINLEYFFSAVDPARYGCGTKLPHNITGLIGVMDGSSSDLRTGLTWQMVEIHEPMRLLLIVEATPKTLLKIAEKYPIVGQLVVNEWIQLVAYHPDTQEFFVFKDGSFVLHQQYYSHLTALSCSKEYYSNKSHHLKPIRIHKA